jgi:uncharacterized protein (TIGR03032 family)
MSPDRDPGAAPPPGTPAPDIRFEHSPELAPLLARLGVSLLVSTYQAGKLVAVGVDPHGALAVSFHTFERAMGIAVRPDRIAVGALNQVWFLCSAPDLAPRVPPAGRHDACFLTRSSHVTGNILGHEMAWAGEDLWVVNTRFSCLCTLHAAFSFVPRWQPPFVTALAGEDRCHLNGLAMEDGRPRYVTALGETDAPQGWRMNRAAGGCLIDVPTGRVVVRSLSMSHSPRVHQGRVWLLDSGTGRLVTANPATGEVAGVAELPGYTRGLALHGSYAFVGLSKVRERSTFGGLPIAERREGLRCGVWAADLATGRAAAHLEFTAGVDEIFDVQVLPGVRLPAVCGPFPAQDNAEMIWVVPGPRQAVVAVPRG